MKRQTKKRVGFHANDATGPHLDVPFWDGQLRELHYRGQRIKAFKSPAENQEAVFAAFQKADWVGVIPVPHLAACCADRRKQLENVVARLNGRQRPPSLRFHACAYGQLISWEPLARRAAARKRKVRKGKRPNKGEG